MWQIHVSNCSVWSIHRCSFTPGISKEPEMLEVYRRCHEMFSANGCLLQRRSRLLRFYLPKASENSRSPGCHGGILPCSLCPVMNLHPPQSFPATSTPLLQSQVASQPRPKFPALIHIVVVVQSLSQVRLFVTPRTAAGQAPLSSTVSRRLLKFMSIESVMPSNHFILCHPLLLPSIFPSIRVFSIKQALHIRWPKY